MLVNDSAARVGTVVAAKYKLLRVLGEGGMGAVYEAEHTVTRRHVAVKLMHASLGWTDGVVQRFLQEAQVAAAIGHPNIIDVLDAGIDDHKAPYVVFEFLKGESAASMLERKEKLPLADALSITTEVLAGLAAAHDRGVVHRDIKPDNVFLHAKEGASVGVKLLDFGISKITGDGIDGGLERQRLTTTGSVMGTVNYMSPEQVRGDSDIDARADVWSVGVMLYELLSGTVPFDGNRVHLVMFKILNGGPVEPLADCPTAVWAVIERALERDRNKRFADARAMLSALAGEDDAGDPLGQTFTAMPRPSFVIESAPAVVLTATPPGSAGTLDPYESAKIRGRKRLLSRGAMLRFLPAAAISMLLGAGAWVASRPPPASARAAVVTVLRRIPPAPPPAELPAVLPVPVPSVPVPSVPEASAVAPIAALPVTPGAHGRRRVRRPAEGSSHGVAHPSAPTAPAAGHDYGSRIVHDPNWGN